MDVRAISSDFARIDADALIVYKVQDKPIAHNALAVDQALNGIISEVIEAGDFSAKAGEALVVYTQGAIPTKRIILIGLGEDDKITLDTVRRTAAIAMIKSRDLKLKHIAAGSVGVNSQRFSIVDSTQAMTEGALLSLYRYHGQKSAAQQDDLPEQLDLVVPDIDAANTGISAGRAFAAGNNLARDLVNLPPNIATPTYLADQARKMGEEIGLSVNILGKSQMEALKMGALLGVAQGSDTPPRFIIMEYNADRKDDYDTLILVGKGVTFDTGGYTLKSSDGMVGMKGDMGGGAAVIGAMRIIAGINPPLHVVGLVPAADNMVSGSAYRPQDVLIASNGKSIEIISTDAEGRLLLADALVYAQRYKPAAVVDIATLTGSINVALGSPAAGLFSNDDNVAEKLYQAGEMSRERVWRMPIYEEYEKPMKSDTADIKNVGDRAGGAGQAAHFLSQFIDYSWAHVDMAGMLNNDGSIPYHPEHSAKGYGARLLAEFVRTWKT